MAHNTFTKTYYQTQYSPERCLEWVERSYTPTHWSGPDATQGWALTKRKHTSGTPPVGAPVWWTGGSKGHGHVAISTGNGNVRSIDTKNGRYNAGTVGECSISSITNTWGSLRYAGWSEDLNGLIVWRADAPTPTPAPKPTPAPETLGEMDEMWLLINRATSAGQYWFVTGNKAVAAGGANDWGGKATKIDVTLEIKNKAAWAAWQKALTFVNW